MPLTSSPSPDFGPAQALAFALAGTVALPPTFPAGATVSIGLFPPPDGAQPGEYEPRFYLRIVQASSPSRVVTRFIDVVDLRAARIHAPVVAGQPDPGWRLVTAADLAATISARRQTLVESLKTGGPTEVGLIDGEVILYVPEAAPVLHRQECGVTAAVSAEGGWSPQPMWFCPIESDGHQKGHRPVSDRGHQGPAGVGQEAFQSQALALCPNSGPHLDPGLEVEDHPE